jgi:DNA mismatch repair protein MutL
VHYLTLAALAHPDIGFTLRQEDRLVWQLPPMSVGRGFEEAVRDRMSTLVGAQLALVRVEGTRRLPAGGDDEATAEEGSEAGGVRVWGFVGAPGVSRATRQDQHIFVNRRPVDNHGLNFALMEGYHTALMKGRYPVACLFIELDPAEVDVNVHPAKREVRFHRERQVRGAVASVIRDGLLAYHRRSAAAETASRGERLSGARVADGGDRAAVTREADHSVGERSGVAQGRQVQGNTTAVASEKLDLVQEGETIRPAATPMFKAVEVATGVPPVGTVGLVEKTNGRSTLTAAGGEEERPFLRVPLRLLGVVARLYVVMESDRGMVLMDQHAAHERVLFEQMLRRLEQGEAPSQRLLLPETVELSVQDSQFVREHLAVLSRLGVGLSEFGERTFLLDALPPFVRVQDTKQFMRDVIDAMVAAGREVNKMRLGEEMVAKTVCRHAVKANDPLANEELEKLIEDLRACSMPYTCPHGRPTLIEISGKELERKFGRAQ